MFKFGNNLQEGSVSQFVVQLKDLLLEDALEVVRKGRPQLEELLRFALLERARFWRKLVEDHRFGEDFPALVQLPVLLLDTLGRNLDERVHFFLKRLDVTLGGLGNHLLGDASTFWKAMEEGCIQACTKHLHVVSLKI